MLLFYWLEISLMSEEIQEIQKEFVVACSSIQRKETNVIRAQSPGAILK